MIEVKIRRIGNSVGILLPAEILEHLQKREGQSVFLAPEVGGSIQMTGADPKFADKMTRAHNIMKRYDNALRELAK
jgi:putative addiction module antidote